MDWNKKITIIIEYVEDHLQRTQEEIDKTEIEHIAGCSFAFFQKIFSYMYGIGFAEYVRNRKMTLAGYDLKHANKKVIDVSYAYGYDSPTSFTKAFQSFHGIPPSKAHQGNVKLHVFPKLRSSIPKESMQWYVEEKSSFRVLAVEIEVSQEFEKKAKEIPAFWNACQRDGTFAKLISIDQAKRKGCMGIFLGQNEKTMHYAIGVESTIAIPSGFIELEIPASTWAVFPCIGEVPFAIQEGWRFLQEEWCVKYPFAHAKAPEIEWYSAGNAYDEAYQSELWIPIVEEEA